MLAHVVQPCLVGLALLIAHLCRSREFHKTLELGNWALRVESGASGVWFSEKRRPHVCGLAALVPQLMYPSSRW